MTICVNGNDIAKRWFDEFLPSLTGAQLDIILVGDDPASLRYVRTKQKKGKEVGVTVNLHHLEQSSSVLDIQSIIHQLNQDSNCNGIILQLPIQGHAQSERLLLDTISPAKDVDCLTTDRLSHVFVDPTDSTLLPATVTGVLKIIDYYSMILPGTSVVMVGTSLLVGGSLGWILEKRYRATVTFCNIDTPTLEHFTRQADVLITATGSPHLISSKHISPKAHIIDVGFGVVDGKIMGDVDTDSVTGIAASITPVPGGVGPLTIAGLFYNLSILYNQHRISQAK